MASILNVDQIRNAAGTSAMTIDSAGKVNSTGHVIQVVQHVQTGGSVTINTTTYTSFVSGSITVSSGSSVWIICTFDSNGGGDGSWHRFRIHRDGTAVGETVTQVYSGSSHNDAVTIQHLDTGLSAGSYTYSVRGQQGSGSTTISDGGKPVMMLVEVGG